MLTQLIYEETNNEIFFGKEVFKIKCEVDDYLCTNIFV